MDIYIRGGQFFALYLEICRDFGSRPFFRLETCDKETIIQLPYAQIIWTPGACLKDEALNRGNNANGPCAQTFSAHRARAAED
ncbi:MAG: hypothetical protein L6Q57_05380 [Alphaproteobacteria bacterium]|nr:hypothetical protein [Alphaproteobacteria bacterium]